MPEIAKNNFIFGHFLPPNENFFSAAIIMIA
jgi:hypothetical protein